MLYSDNPSYVFIVIPKTATRSMYDFLMGEYNGKIYEDHATTVPPHLANKFTFCIVRNPYERACSAWWFFCKSSPEAFRKWGYEQINF